jgi:hypothetical protein
MIWGFSKGALLGLCPHSSLEADGVESLCMQSGDPHCEAAGDGDHRKHTRCLPKRLVKGDGCKNLLVESRSRCSAFSERIVYLEVTSSRPFPAHVCSAREQNGRGQVVHKEVNVKCMLYDSETRCPSSRAVSLP